MLIAWKVNNCWTGLEKQDASSHHTYLGLTQVNQYKWTAQARIPSAAWLLCASTVRPWLQAETKGMGEVLPPAQLI